MTPPRSPQTQAQDLPSEYPHLRKTIAPTYRSRLLKVEVVDGEKRYFDESAVFVGRLVKEEETEESLLHRFGHYGPVVSGTALWVVPKLTYSATLNINHRMPLLRMGLEEFCTPIPSLPRGLFIIR